MVMFKTPFFEKISLNGLWPARIFRKLLGSPKQVHTRREGKLQGQKPSPRTALGPSSPPGNEPQHREQNPPPTCTGKLAFGFSLPRECGKIKEMNLRRQLAGDLALATTESRGGCGGARGTMYNWKDKFPLVAKFLGEPSCNLGTLNLECC